jgi:hypothetical protein
MEHTSDKPIKITKYNYRYSLYFTLNDLAEFMGEYTHDGERENRAWKFWEWLDKQMKKRYGTYKRKTK